MEKFVSLRILKDKRMTIQLEVQDDLVAQIGKDAILRKMQTFLEWEKLRLLAWEIHQSMQEAGLDYDQLWQQARKQAWEQHKKQHLSFLSES
ncbi:MAG: hypothetical protein EAZ08_03820 [Cytophagales bacterium]|nr:MAG: hypothetical protein EAZ08_03820 [Cytophagales bacterium]